jgi:hypothetical protein
MSNDHSDDDVIVISEDEARYETRDENAAVHPADRADDDLAEDDVAEDDLAANDQATEAVPSGAGRFGSMTSPGEAAASGAVDPDADDDPDAHPATEPVTMTGSSHGTSAEAPAYSGTATGDPADSAASDTPAGSTVNGTGNGTGSAIPMPGSSATPAASGATPDSNWPQIQALFVDDPLAAVQQAADVVGGALAALTAAANNREQTLRGGWQGDGTGTEDLRTALREYRDLAGRLSTLAQDL